MLTAFALAYVSLASTLLVAILSILLNQYRFDRGATLFRCYFLLAAITELILVWLRSERHNNMVVVNIFCLVQFTLIMLALASWPSARGARMFILTIGVLTAIVLGVFVYPSLNQSAFDPIGTAVQNLVLTIISGYMLIHLTRDRSEFLFMNYKFWFAVAVFIYFSVSATMFATANMLVENGTFLRKYTWVINSVLTLMANMCYVKGLLCLPMKRN